MVTYKSYEMMVDLQDVEEFTARKWKWELFALAIPLSFYCALFSVVAFS